MNLRLGRLKIEIDYFGALVISLMLAVDRMGIMLPALAACCVHELGHVAAIILTKGKVAALRLCPWGIQIVSPSLTEGRASLAVAVSGPAVNLLLWAVLRKLVPSFATIQLICGAFNLLPCNGLDGGDALRGALSLFLCERATDRVMFAFSCAVGMICAALGAVLLIGMKNPSLLVAGLYLVALQLIQINRSR